MCRPTFLMVPLFFLSCSVCIADEDSPEVKALISKFKDDVKSKMSATRVSAYTAMGELGPKAVNARRLIAAGMLDPNVKVQVAAADALKKVDEKIYNLATAIVINKDIKKIAEVKALGKDGQCLTPLILNHANNAAPMASLYLTKEGSPLSPKPAATAEARLHLQASVEALVAIAPEDLDVNRVIVNMLANPVPKLRAVALDQVSSLKNQKLALTNVLAIAKSNDDAATRVKAINLTPTITDENTSPVAMKVLESLRFDNQPKVREAVEEILKKKKP